METTATTDKNGSWTAEFHDAVMFGDEPCPHCDGSQMLRVGNHSSQCPCQELKWKRKTIERILPLRYHRSNLYTLQPSTASKLPLERQQQLIDLLRKRENRDKGYFLYGVPGTSKTTFAAALVRNAIERDWRRWLYKNGPMKWDRSMWIRYINWDGLMGEYLAYQNDRNADPPSVTAKLIREAAEADRRPVLCIEEIDKSRLTEYKANKLFDLVQAIDANTGQLIITTNHKSKEDFEAFLYKTDNEAINLAGEPVWRRIMDNCTPVRFEQEAHA
jgi:DNA replication protein DnaC